MALDLMETEALTANEIKTADRFDYAKQTKSPMEHLAM